MQFPGERRGPMAMETCLRRERPSFQRAFNWLQAWFILQIMGFRIVSMVGSFNLLMSPHGDLTFVEKRDGTTIRIKLGRQSPSFGTSFFADDLLIFTKATALN